MNEYGPRGRTAIQVATSSGWCTQDSLAAFISARLRQGTVSRAMVASWESGREHMPVDVLVLLCQHVPEHAQELLQLLAQPLDLVVVERAPGDAAGDTLGQGCRTIAHVAAVLEHLAAERDLQGDGGLAITGAELASRLLLIRRAERELATMRVATETAASVAHGTNRRAS
mgnify:CR=1 FL=1